MWQCKPDRDANMKKNNKKEKNEIYISSKKIDFLNEKLEKNNDELANISLIIIWFYQQHAFSAATQFCWQCAFLIMI